MAVSELGDGGACSAAMAGRCCASAAVGSEGRARNGNVSWEAHGRMLQLVLARSGLSRLAAGDARCHAAVNFCNRSDYYSIDSELPVEPNSVT